MTITSNPLIIPMVVEAFVVNDKVRTGKGSFLRTQMQYENLADMGNAQALQSGQDEEFSKNGSAQHNGRTISNSDYYNGVYLKWRLPKALTHGEQDSTQGTTQYPVVPNRWLVFRINQSTQDVSTWIIESDYVYTTSPEPTTISGQASNYVQVNTLTNHYKEPVSIHIGKNTQLSSGESWAEPGTSLSLTVMSPGNPAFAFYQPACNNIFSFVDPLGNERHEAASFTYMVVGWYGVASEDILNVKPKDFASKLKDLSWSLPSRDSGTITKDSLLYGFQTDVAWQTKNKPDGGAPTGTSPISIAIGNTSAEALTALITAQGEKLGGEPVDAQLLEAFQLDILEYFDQPDGAARLEEALERSCFQRYTGGYSWSIVTKLGSKSTGAVPATPAWLLTLNQAQQALDQELNQLVTLQKQLYTLWWKCMTWSLSSPPSGGQQAVNDLTLEEIRHAIDPGRAGSVAAQVKAQLGLVTARQKLVPNGDTPEALQAAIRKYASEKNLPDTQELKRSAAPKFYKPNNPSLMIAGAGASGIVKAQKEITCRFQGDLISAVNCGGAHITASSLHGTLPVCPSLTMTGAPTWLTALLPDLLHEVFLLNPANAGVIASVVTGVSSVELKTAMSSKGNFNGTYPYSQDYSASAPPQQWTKNPWHPLRLIWGANYYPLPGQDSWSFDGVNYTWKGTGASSDSITMEGLIQLAPTASLNLQARIEKYINQHPGLDPDEKAAFQNLLQFVTTNDSWDFLSQALDGFNEQLRMGMSGVFLSPDATASMDKWPIQEQLGNVHGYPPNLGPIPIQGQGTPHSDCQVWRAGQMELTNLIVVDEWGQALWPVDAYTSRYEDLFLPASLTPILESEHATLIVGATTQETAKSAVSAASAPTITALSPSVIEAGMAESSLIPMSVYGTNFSSDCNVQWLNTEFSNDPVQLQTTYVSPTSLIAHIPANFTAAPGSVTITVATSSEVSGAETLKLSAGMFIRDLSPQQVTPGSDAFTLTVTGVGFKPLAKVYWNSLTQHQALDTTYVSPTKLTATVPASLITSQGAAKISVRLGAIADGLGTIDRSVVQFPPRLLQGARLNFNAVSATDDSKVLGPLNPDVDPICGWLLPNHLDHALDVYEATGKALGAMKVIFSVTDQAHLVWVAAPDAQYTSIATISENIPHLGVCLSELITQPIETFKLFLSAIDETLWTTVPMGAHFDSGSATLSGRPLALVRASVAFELDGKAELDPSWQYTLQAQTPDILSYTFPIELGNRAQLEDGLIGYFTAGDYSSFNIAKEAGVTSGSYLKPIGQTGNYIKQAISATPTYLSLLVDPRASVHATTSILPTMDITLPEKQVADALAKIKPQFSINGMMTHQQTQSEKTQLIMPKPAYKAEKTIWQWKESSAATWVAYDLKQSDTTAHLQSELPRLRQGVLTLTDDN